VDSWPNVSLNNIGLMSAFFTCRYALETYVAKDVS
jgi:hypothetical protein